jgi:hypothetical protein
VVKVGGRDEPEYDREKDDGAVSPEYEVMERMSPEKVLKLVNVAWIT